jgi:hypothetical protein
VIIKIYMDESGTHGAPLMILSGLVGRLGQWADFDEKWRKLLMKSDLTYFHSKTMKSTDGEFRGWTRKRKFEFTQAAATIAEKHALLGFSIMLRDEEYRQFYKSGDWPRRSRPDSQYGLCLRFCLSWLPRHLCEQLRRDDLTINFILEAGHKNAGDAVRVFDEAKLEGDPALVRVLGAISFDDKRKWPGLQGADAIAYNAFGGEMREDVPIIDRPAGSTLKDDRRATKSKTPIYRCHVTEVELREFRKLHAISRSISEAVSR